MELCTKTISTEIYGTEIYGTEIFPFSDDIRDIGRHRFCWYTASLARAERDSLGQYPRNSSWIQIKVFLTRMLESLALTFNYHMIKPNRPKNFLKSFKEVRPGI